MKDDLFKCILANSFDDTEENVKWLVDNEYIKHISLPKDGGFHYYWQSKEFNWRGPRTNRLSMQLDLVILSKYSYER